MARTATLGRLTWQVGEVVDVVPASVQSRTLTFALPGWPGHRPGQHVDIRLTAEDGYQAARSYSIASPPELDRVAITVEELPDGEVSPYLVHDVIPGDLIELRGPVGGYFVWEVALGGPLMLIAGGSGIVPLMAMLRHRIIQASDVPVRLLYSARSQDDVIYDAELRDIAANQAGVEIFRTYTRQQPPGWDGYSRRVDAALLAEVVWPVAEGGHAFVCGPTGFVEAVAATLVQMGFDGTQIKTERFGPTGG